MVNPPRHPNKIERRLLGLQARHHRRHLGVGGNAELGELGRAVHFGVLKALDVHAASDDLGIVLAQDALHHALLHVGAGDGDEFRRDASRTLFEKNV